jgi:hypothetical protein
MPLICIGTKCSVLCESKFVYGFVNDIRTISDKLELKLTNTLDEFSRYFTDWISVDKIYLDDGRSKSQKRKLSVCEENKFKHIIQECFKINFGTIVLKPSNIITNNNWFAQNNMCFMCPICLCPAKNEAFLNHIHKQYCIPPGRAIYDSDSLVLYEVDGSKEHKYCSNLWHLSECFLPCKGEMNSKFLKNWLFYALYVKVTTGIQFVGYFSKCKTKESDIIINNINCIMTLPNYRKKGYGQFLISLSYELVRRRGVFGTPEKPLTKFGKRSFLYFWKHELKTAFVQANNTHSLTLGSLRQITRMTFEDMIETLCGLNLMYADNGKLCIKIDEDQLKLFSEDIKNCYSNFDPSLLIW